MNKYGKIVVLFSLLLFVCWAKMPDAKADTASLHGMVGNTMGIDMSTAYVGISLYDYNQHFLYPTTLDQATGTYSFSGISPGTYQASIQINNLTYRQDVNIAAGDNVLDYTFAGSTSPGNGTVSGTMYLPDGSKATGNQVTLQGIDAVFGAFRDYWFNSSTNNTDGSFTFYNVPPGNYVIEGYMSDGGANSNITVLADGSIVQNVYLSQYATAKQISGRITDNDGSNVSANVYLYNSSASELLSRSIGPYYNFSQLNSGSYLVKAVSADGEFAATQEVALTDASQTVDLQLTNAAPSLTWSVSGSYTVGSQLSVEVTGYSDAEGDPEGTPLYQWLSREHGTNEFYAISGATGSSYTIRPEDAGKDITVFVTPVATKGTLQGQTMASMEYQVQDLSGFAEALPGSTPVQDEPFSLVISGAKDFNGGTVDGTFEVQATSGGTVIADGQVAFANGSGTLTGLTLNAADDQTVYVQVIGATTPQPVTVTLLTNQAPTLSVSLSGEGAVGSTITANTYNYSDAEGDLQDVPEYQWMTSSAANGTFSPITGATGDHYTAQLGDYGNYVAVAVTPKALRGTRAGTAVLSDPIYIEPGPVSFQMEPSLDVYAMDAGQLKSYPAWIEDANAGVPTEYVAGISYTVSTDAAGAPLFSALPEIDAEGSLTFNALPDVRGDAAVSVAMKVSRLDGTVLETEAQSFVIHVNTMHVAISGVEDGHSYNTTVTPIAQQGDYTVTLTKYWYNGEGTTSQVVDNYTLGTPISDEGQYVLDVVDNGSGDFVSYAFAIDRTAPTVDFFIDYEQMTWTSSRNVVLFAYPTNETSYQSMKIMVSDNGTDWSDPQEWSWDGTNWLLPEGDGEKKVYAKLIDSAGNVSEPVAASIYLSTAGVPLGFDAYPENGMIRYANGVVLDVTNVSLSDEAGSIKANLYEGDWTGANLQAAGPVLELSGFGYNISPDTPATIHFPLPGDVNASQVGIYALTASGNWQPLSTTIEENGYAAAQITSYAAYGLFVPNAVPAAPNADLSQLSLSVGNLSPAFASSQTEYKVYVDDQTASATVTAGVAQSGSTLVINGVPVSDKTPQTINLTQGITSVPIVVTSYDGMATKTYTINFVRGALKSLSASPGAVSHMPGTTQYSVTVEQNVYAISISAAAWDPNATFSINDVPANANGGTVTQSVYLNDLKTTVEIRIDSPNHDSATYDVVVYKSGIKAMSFQNNSTVAGMVYGPVTWTVSQFTTGDYVQVVFMDNQDNIVGQPVITIADPGAGYEVVPATAIPAGATKIGVVLFAADGHLLGKQSTVILDSGDIVLTGHDGVINMQDVLSAITGHSGSLTKDQIRQLLQQITSKFVKSTAE